MQTSSVAAKGIPIRKAPLPALSSSNLPASFSTNGPSIVPRDKKGLAAGKALSSPSLPCASSSSAEFNDLIPHHQQPFHFASCHSAHHHEPIHNIDDKEQDVGDLVFDDLFISKETTTPTFRTTTSTSSSSSSSSTSTTCTSTPGSHHRHHHQRQPSTINSGSEGEDSSSLTEGAGSEGEDNGGGEGFEHDSGDDDDRHHLGEEDGEESEEVGPSHYLDLETSKVDLNDFTLLKLIGQGGYGKVYQVQKKDTEHVYAMKVLRKKHLITTGALEGTMVEREVLRSIRHPFIVSLHYAFQTEGKVYLVMDYLNGGQLFFHLREEAMFSEDLVRFYTAEIVLALEHLHQQGIIHRDLKPENILLNSDGNLCLTDFGLSKAVEEGQSARTFCGTLEYMAPEMLKGQPYGKATDWWSLGILIYDMLTGNPPWTSANNSTLQKKILTQKLRLPTYLSREAASIIRQLLNRDAKKRLGSGKNGIRDIKEHPFFKGVPWKKMLNKEVDPPFRPRIEKGVFDVGNFDKKFTDAAPTDSPVKSIDDITASQRELFAGFSYVRSCSPIAFSPSTASNGVDITGMDSAGNIEEEEDNTDDEEEDTA
jgi:serine/threonine protein kinase